MMKLRLEHKDNFLIRAAILFVLFIVIQNSIYMPEINEALTRCTANSSTWILNNLFHRPAQSVEIDAGYQWFVTEKIGSGVKIAHPCNAFELYCLYWGFLIAVADISFRRKLNFLLLGTMSIFVFNTMRIVGLFLIQGRWPAFFHFMHKYLFQSSAYLLIFGLWYLALRNKND